MPFLLVSILNISCIFKKKENYDFVFGNFLVSEVFFKVDSGWISSTGAAISGCLCVSPPPIRNSRPLKPSPWTDRIYSHFKLAWEQLLAGPHWAAHCLLDSGRHFSLPFCSQKSLRNFLKPQIVFHEHESVFLKVSHGRWFCPFKKLLVVIALKAKTQT